MLELYDNPAMSQFDGPLRASGMRAGESENKATLLRNLAERLDELSGGASRPPIAFFIPGRLECLGKHTDYAGGRSLICAIERGICLIATRRTDTQVRILDVGRKLEACFSLDDADYFQSSDWSKYAVTAAQRLTQDFPSARHGADIVFESDLPRASGMSSSSALTIAIFLALAEVNTLGRSETYRQYLSIQEDLAGYLAAIESGADFATFSGGRGVGTFGGSEDHVAILCSRAGFLRQYAYCPIRLEREVAVPENYTFVIGVSGIQADKTGNAQEAYNRMSLATRKIVEAWRVSTGRDDSSLAAALSSIPNAGEKLREILTYWRDPNFPSEFMLNRLAQFAEESNEIVPAAAVALAQGEMDRFGALADRSQFLAEKLLGNQTPETIELARSARALGAAAASAFGAGFGGSVWALVPVVRAEEFREAWMAKYRRTFPIQAAASAFFVTGAGPGLMKFQL